VIATGYRICLINYTQHWVFYNQPHKYLREVRVKVRVKVRVSPQ
jgi:hypothetical protein